MAAALWLAGPGPTQAMHDLKADRDELLGPTWWGIFVVIPIPFIVIGLIGWLLWRASREPDPPHDDT